MIGMSIYIGWSLRVVDVVDVERSYGRRDSMSRTRDSLRDITAF